MRNRTLRSAEIKYCTTHYTVQVKYKKRGKNLPFKSAETRRVGSRRLWLTQCNDTGAPSGSKSEPDPLGDDDRADCSVGFEAGSCPMRSHHTVHGKGKNEIIFRAKWGRLCNVSGWQAVLYCQHCRNANLLVKAVL